MTHASKVQHGKLLPALLLLALAASVAAQDYHVFVYRVGDGTTTLVSAGSPVFLDEYVCTSTTAILVRSIPLPTTASGLQMQLISSGTASSEGQLNRSTDGQYIILMGYSRDLGLGGSLASTTSAAVPRTIGRVAASGLTDTSTALTDFSSANNPRGATSTDGTVFWAVGSAASGVPATCYAVLGATTSVTLGVSTFNNAKQISIFDNQLYASSGSGTNTYKGVETIGTGLPTTSGQAVTRLPGLSDTISNSSCAFFFADLDIGVAGLDTLYIADDHGTSGGIKKYSLVGGNWALNGAMGAAADAYRGLTAAVNGTDVTIFATRKGGGGASGGGELVAAVDSTGYNVAPTATPTLLATATTNIAFRGVALGPTGAVVSAGLSTVSASPSPVPADGTATSTITVTLKDAGGHTVGGRPVSLVGDPATSTITIVNGTTNSSGQATFTVKSTTVNTVNYTATDTAENVIVTQTAQVSFTPVADATQSTVSANPTSVVANGTATSTITVTLKDAGGTPVSGKTVTLAGSPTTSTISAASGPSDANGQVTFTVKSTTANTVTYTATDTTDNVTVTQTEQVAFTPGPPDAGTSTVVADPTLVVANGTTTSTITVTLKDANGNVVSGRAVALDGSPATSTIATVNGTTDANGQATFTAKSTTANTVTYTATEAPLGVIVAQTAQVTFTPGPVTAAQSTVSANPTSVVADGVATSIITVTLKDANGNAVSGKNVSLAGDPNTSVIAPPTGPTDTNGQTTITVKSSTANTVTYTATDTTDGVTVTQTAEVTFSAVTFPPGTQLEVRIGLTIEGSVSIGWGGGTTGKNAGDVTALHWTVTSATTGADLGLGQTLASNDPTNNIVMKLKNTSNTGTHAKVSATVISSGGWNVGTAAADNTFEIKARLGLSAEVPVLPTAGDLTGTAVLTPAEDQELILTVLTPLSATNTANLGVERTIAVALTAVPE